MDVSWRWQLPILLMVFCPILGSGTSGAQCQDNSRFGNDSIYTQDTIAKDLLGHEGIRHGMNALGRFPHDVRCTGHDEVESCLAEMDFTNNFNTCPANETVRNLPCVDITGGKTPIEPELGFKFQLDVFGDCFNITVIEVNGEKIDYIEMFEKLNLCAPPQVSINGSSLYKTKISESDEMKVNFPSNFVVHLSENKSRMLNVTGFTHTGKCKEFGIRRKVVETCPRIYTILSYILSTLSLMQILNIVLVAIASLLMLICWQNFLLNRLRNQLLQRAAVHAPPAPAG